MTAVHRRCGAVGRAPAVPFPDVAVGIRARDSAVNRRVASRPPGPHDVRVRTIRDDRDPVAARAIVGAVDPGISLAKSQIVVTVRDVLALIPKPSLFAVRRDRLAVHPVGAPSRLMAIMVVIPLAAVEQGRAALMFNSAGGDRATHDENQDQRQSQNTLLH